VRIGSPTLAAPAATPVKGTVSLSDVTVRYGEVAAVTSLSLEVAAGEFLAILGPSGSGKTTTMRVIGGFVRPTAGSVRISGIDVGDLPPFKRDANTVFQSYALFPHMTVEDNVAYALKMRRVGRGERRRRAAEMLELVQLGHAAKRRPSELSGGMQQRVAIARALAARPSVLLLDEPLGALDKKLREEMQFELRHLQTTLGTTFIYVTHDQEEALALSDRLVVMHDGRIEQSGPPAEVYDAPATLWVAGFVGSSNQLAGVVRSVGAQVEIDCDVTRIVADHAHDTLHPGDRVVAVVRPDDVLLGPATPGAERVNVVEALVEDRINVGSQVRAVARTRGGIELVAQGPRATVLADGDLHPGQQVDLRWDAGAVHVYLAS
jgi:ABC-type Fe3+/spermidine/putrescine transport system ATPase subunit